MDGDELKHQGIQWLRDGGEIEAAAVLERCDLVERYVDEGFPLGSDEVITIIDVVVYASRLDINLATRDARKIAAQIEKTLHELVEHGTAIRNIIWRGKVGGNPTPSDSRAGYIGHPF